MKKIGILFALVTAIFLLVACGHEQGEIDAHDQVKIVSSFTLLTDMAKEIGGDAVEVHNLVPTGQDPHEYEPKPEDLKKTTDAHILLYNGLNLEGGQKGWFFKMIEATGQDVKKAYNVTSFKEKVKPLRITSHDGKDEEINPHAFISPQVGVIMAQNIKAALMDAVPAKKALFEKRANAYIDRLNDMDRQYTMRINSISSEDRVLVTSERAFQYLADDYGLREGYIWAIDTEENGSPSQMKNLVAFLKEHKVPVVFVETNVDARPMETVSKESGVPIYDQEIYSDEIGAPGDEVDTYMKYLQYNIDVLTQGLGGK
ncbi:metal ABC transporter solute-binding protein, Zn/Mn family [Kurthia sibirica]|uniref:Zinc ABC transporter substrate-binding protein n=1 Tax=Kurthia sibirica TaxID=202750 RepID=A0A2U3APL2_9BACL|nr:zinc ABC transporter substrate-binding protein [Kurthia sibirica]PWI26395.1 zinc ABC transporter substrate-binding protein [Kurthia sibirica]GEK34168.1 metal ABC transporter substrate-binding protein [Kurthia sibirica]